MTPVIPSSTSSISLIPGPTFNTKNTNGPIKCFNLKRSTRRTLYAQDCVLPLSTPLRLFPHIRTFGSTRKPRFAVSSAAGVDVAVEQSDSPVSDQSESPVSDQDSVKTSEPTSTVDKTKQRSRPVRKSDMPPVKDEELIPGASFTGKVRSIQPFGAFVDFGAFTDGLVHVSRLSDGYVKDVANVVSVGQEVKVKLVEANIETGRIALTMRENEPASGGESSSRPPRKTGQKSNRGQTEGRKSTKFVKGQDLEGTVKNLTRSGAFINLPEGEEGFLPASEEADEGFGSIMGTGSSLEIGQEVKVRVLRIARGQVTLTMKKDEDNTALDSKLQGKVFTATNPFLVAFRKNKDIASFLDDREKTEEAEVKVKPDSDEEVKPEIASSEPDTEASVEETEVKPDSEEVVEPEIVSSEPEIQASIEETEVKPDSEEEVKPEIVSSEPEIQASVEETEVKPISDEEVKPEIVSSEPEIQASVKETEVKPISDEEVKPEVADEPIIENMTQVEDVKNEPVSDENGSITSSTEQIDAPVTEETVTEDAEMPAVPTVDEVIENQIEEPETKVETNAEIPVEEEKVVAAGPTETATKGLL